MNTAVLSDRDLKKLVESGNIYVKQGAPINLKTQLGPSSVDLRLGDKFILFQRSRSAVIDTKNPKMQDIVEEHTVSPDDGIVIHPGEFVLGTTHEFIRVPVDMVARLEGRSSYGRLGIAVHSTAGYCDPGWEGQITLEIQNLGVVPVKLYPGERVCQVVFEKMTSPAEVPYNKKHDAKYMNQETTTASKLDLEKR